MRKLQGYRDHVKYLYLCDKDMAILMEDEGWIYVNSTRFSEQKFDRIFRLASTLLTTGKPTGYFEMRDPPFEWCGITVREGGYSFGMYDE